MTCCICGEAFEPKNPRKPPKTCSRACTNKMVWAAGRAPGGPRPAPRPERTCRWCGKRFMATAEHLGRASARQYCSRTCTGRAKTKGGLYFRVTDGRWIVNLRDGSKQLFSRCLMEGYVGRHLAYDEVVHHVNGDRTDDRIENLQIVSRVEHPTLHVAEMRAGCARRKALLKAHGRAGFDGHSELAPTGRYGR